MQLTLALALAMALTLAVPGGAYECEPSTAEASFDTGASTEGTPRLYVVDELCPVGTDCIGAFWVYAESNGLDGLQRDDSSRDDTCGGQIESDTLVL